MTWPSDSKDSHSLFGFRNRILRFCCGVMKDGKVLRLLLRLGVSVGVIIQWHVPPKHSTKVTIKSGKLLQFPAKPQPKIEHVFGVRIVDARRRFEIGE